MKKDTFNEKWIVGLGLGFLFASFVVLYAQQQDVPEPVFINFSIHPVYVPTYHGRDPFKKLDNIERQPQVSISELDYKGIINVGGTSIALFCWKGNTNIRYTLKSRKLYGGADKVIDGVVGDVSQTEVVLIQGDQKVVYSRNKK
jgi:hypothetical protein